MQKTKERSLKVPTGKTNQKSEAVCLIIPLCPFVGAMYETEAGVVMVVVVVVVVVVV